MANKAARVLTIAGSDSGGGAGIQADIKTITCLGGYAASAITALTAQNTHGVSGIHPVPASFVTQQIEAVLSDIGADCIKTGMLLNAEIIEAVAKCLNAHTSSHSSFPSPRRGEDGRGAVITTDHPHQSPPPNLPPMGGGIIESSNHRIIKSSDHDSSFPSPHSSFPFPHMGKDSSFTSPHRGLNTNSLVFKDERGALPLYALQQHNYPQTKSRENARKLRKNLTEAEKKLWQQIRKEQFGVKFRKQHPVGSYIADFACMNPRIIIELDGGQHTEEKNIPYDIIRTDFLKSQGFQVLRFWNTDIFENLNGVLESIQTAIAHQSPPPHLKHQAVGVSAPIGGGTHHSLSTTHHSPFTYIQNTIPLVLDPVMVAKGGAPLLEPDAITALRTLLIPRATLLTPNLPEASLLIGRPIITLSDMHEAITDLRALGAQAVLLKGGHLAGDTVTDMLITSDHVEIFTDPRINSKNTHGTGCTLASAIACGIAQGLPLPDAVVRARHYVRAAMSGTPQIGSGHGPLWHNVGQRY